MLAGAGFTGAVLDTALGIWFAESSGYVDAVGDIERARIGPYDSEQAAKAALEGRRVAGKSTDYIVRRGVDEWCTPDKWELWNPTWGCSLGGPQVRCLREPTKYSVADRVRVASELHGNAQAQAHAMFIISDGGKRFDLWSTYRNKTHLPFVGKDFEIKTGHARAGEWSK